MTHVLVLLLALLIGVVAGLRALTPPAVVAWAAVLGWLHVEGSWASWIAHPIVVGRLTVLLVIELITDQLPKTPSRKTRMQFAARLITAGFAGAVIGTGWGYEFTALAAGVVGAFLGTIGGYEARKRLAAAFGRDLPARAAGGRRRRRSRFRGRVLGEPGVTRQVDAIIVGAGQAGPSPPGRLTAAGQTVVVEERKLIDGTCVNTGCIPTKTWVASAHTRRTWPGAAPSTASVASGPAVFGVFNGGDATDIVNDEDTRIPFRHRFTCGVHTLNLKRADRVARALGAGTVSVNTYNMFDATTPFGGYKSSGFGREGGPEVMENYTQYKSVWIDLS